MQLLAVIKNRLRRLSWTAGGGNSRGISASTSFVFYRSLLEPAFTEPGYATGSSRLGMNSDMAVLPRQAPNDLRPAPLPRESDPLPGSATVVTDGALPDGFAIPGECIPMPHWKRATDIFGASVGLVLLSPLFLVIAMLVVLDSRGGPFFRQKRVGHNGKIFVCWKFRSMHIGADKLLQQLIEENKNEANGFIFKMKEDPRRTRVGKILRRTSLDELPQLINVLGGQMSLVGPRPPLSSEVAKYEPGELRRLATVPGMTGLWQVTLRGRHEFQDMVRLDIEYGERLSPKLDFEILLKTVPTVLFGHGSY